jgi:hypothetical protein
MAVNCRSLLAACAIVCAVTLSPSATANDVNAISSEAVSVDGTEDETLEVKHVSSTISSITIRWNATSKAANGSGNDALVHIEAQNLATKMTVVSPPVKSSSSGDDDDLDFTIPDLAINADYEVCVVRVNDGKKACQHMRTITVVRFDTVLAVLLALGFILFLILMAIVCWRCAVRAAEPKDERVIGDNEEGVKVCNASPTADDQLGDEKAPLLVPGNKTGTPAPNNEQPQQPPASLYLFLAGPALDYDSK